jgi:hypothetical protein
VESVALPHMSHGSVEMTKAGKMMWYAHAGDRKHYDIVASRICRHSESGEEKQKRDSHTQTPNLALRLARYTCTWCLKYRKGMG